LNNITILNFYDTTGGYYWSLQLVKSTQNFMIYDPNGEVEYHSDAVISDTDWHHIIVKYDKSATKFIILMDDVEKTFTPEAVFDTTLGKDLSIIDQLSTMSCAIDELKIIDGLI
jgi:hypothetical protein